MDLSRSNVSSPPRHAIGLYDQRSPATGTRSAYCPRSTHSKPPLHIGAVGSGDGAAACIAALAAHRRALKLSITYAESSPAPPQVDAGVRPRSRPTSRTASMIASAHARRHNHTQFSPPPSQKVGKSLRAYLHANVKPNFCRKSDAVNAPCHPMHAEVSAYAMNEKPITTSTSPRPSR
jgi:hypothetical protein